MAGHQGTQRVGRRPYGSGRYREAVGLAEEGETRAERLLGADHRLIATFRNNLAERLRTTGPHGCLARGTDRPTRQRRVSL